MSKKDNSTLASKVRFRRRLLSHSPAPVVIEAHGGKGVLYGYCYRKVRWGVVIEKDPGRAAALAKARPNWLVYQASAELVLEAPVGQAMGANVLDLDPYGDPWPCLVAFWGSSRMWPPQLGIVVNDGLRQKLAMGGGWTAGSMEEAVRRWGNAALYPNYLDICRTLAEEQAQDVGYNLTHWEGAYAGYAQQMTHWAAVFERGAHA